MRVGALIRENAVVRVERREQVQPVPQHAPRRGTRPWGQGQRAAVPAAGAPPSLPAARSPCRPPRPRRAKPALQQKAARTTTLRAVAQQCESTAHLCFQPSGTSTGASCVTKPPFSDQRKSLSAHEILQRDTG